MKNILVILAHHDDEIFIYEQLRRHISSQDHIYMAYLTFDSKFGDTENTREKESLKTLSDLSIPSKNIYLIGREAKLDDGRLYTQLEQGYQALCLALKTLEFDTIYSLAWEGGHHDHDAAHLISVAYAHQHKVSEIFEFSLYNGYLAPAGLFRVMTLPPGNSPDLLIQFTFGDALKNFLALFNYPTQKTTFIGLSLGIFVNLFLLKRVKYRKIFDIDYNTKPHKGQLFYESRFKIQFEDFSASTYDFIQKHIPRRNYE